MKIKNPRIINVFVFAIFFSLCIFSCQKKDSIIDSTALQDLTLNIERPEIKTELPLWVPGNYSKVAVVFGHGYETPEIQEPILQELDRVLGLAKNNGLIIPLTFPKEYFSNKRVRNAWLYEALQDQDVFAIITIAAPERTHYALATLQDKSFNAKVYSIFPQDDVLGTESGSVLVLDYQNLGAKIDDSTAYIPQNRTELPSSSFEEQSQYSDDITKILIPLLKRIKSSNNLAIPEDSSSLIEFLQNAYQSDFPNCKIEKYTDAQTGIKSQNHFVLGTYDE